MSAIATELRSQVREERKEELPKDQGIEQVRSKNIFEEIKRLGHDEDFEPHTDSKFIASSAPAGSKEKIRVLKWRVEMGYPLWHDDDRVDFRGIAGRIATVIAKKDTEDVDSPINPGSSTPEEAIESDESTESEVRHQGGSPLSRRSSLQSVIKGATVALNHKLADKRRAIAGDASYGSGSSSKAGRALSAQEIISKEREAIKKEVAKRRAVRGQGVVCQEKSSPEVLGASQAWQLVPAEPGTSPESLALALRVHVPDAGALHTVGASSSTIESGPLKPPVAPTEDEQRVLRMYVMLQEALSNKAITKSALIEFTNQNRKILSALVPGEESA